jgi:hypothetical protein
MGSQLLLGVTGRTWSPRDSSDPDPDLEREVDRRRQEAAAEAMT